MATLFTVTTTTTTTSNVLTIESMNQTNINLTSSELITTVLPYLSQAQKTGSTSMNFILRFIIICCYCIIFLLGIIGNSLVVYVVCKNKSMQSVTNVFITNLAVSDILMCLLCVPFTPISFFAENWFFGKFLCHLVPFSLGVCVYVSTLTSLAIAIDRYFVIVHPFKPRMRLGVCLLLIAVVWIVAISISLPLAIYVKFTAGTTVSTCKELWPQQMLKRFFELASLVLQYLIPFIVITFCYTVIWIILSKRTKPGRTKEKEQIELKRKKRTNRMLVAMVAIFAGCWMPLNIVHLIMEFKKNFTDSTNFSIIFFTAHVIAMSSTVYNPFLYSWLNDNFRKEFRSVIPCVFTVFHWCRRLAKQNSKNQLNDDYNEDYTNANKDHIAAATAAAASHNGNTNKTLPTQALQLKQSKLNKYENSTCIDYVSKLNGANGSTPPNELIQLKKLTKNTVDEEVSLLPETKLNNVNGEHAHTMLNEVNEKGFKVVKI